MRARSTAPSCCSALARLACACRGESERQSSGLGQAKGAKGTGGTDCRPRQTGDRGQAAAGPGDDPVARWGPRRRQRKAQGRRQQLVPQACALGGLPCPPPAAHLCQRGVQQYGLVVGCHALPVLPQLVVGCA